MAAPIRHALIASMLIFSIMTEPVAALVTKGFGSPCQHGSHYDELYDRCDCTPDYHGVVCETSFIADDPCFREAKLPEIFDSDGSHGVGGAQTAEKVGRSSPSGIDFSAIAPGWYKIRSPSGNRLVEGCDSGVKDADCGGRAAYVLHNVTSEGSNSRSLFKAKAFEVWRGAPECHLTQETYYPVRLLRCSISLQLYFLLPLPKTHSYCIGDGPVSHELGLKPPKLQLSGNSLRNGTFRCTVFGNRQVASKSYSVEFLRTKTDGKAVQVPNCFSTGNKFLDVLENSTYYCPYYEIIEPRSNIYGSTLICRVKVENSELTVSSNIHSFTFRYNFSQGIDSIRPDKPVQLCIDLSSVPLTRVIAFSLSVSRYSIGPKDRMGIAVLQNNPNSTRPCDFSTFVTQNWKKVCAQIILYNTDVEGKRVFGLNSSEQVSLVKLEMFYQSSSDGVNTYTPDGRPGSAKFDVINLKVDLRSQLDTSGVQQYLHIFSDPFVKPVGGTYSSGSVFELNVDQGQVASFRVMRHKLMPYEVQVLLARPQNVDNNMRDTTVTTRVAIRYWDSVITIFGNDGVDSGRLQYRTECNASKCEDRATRRGVLIESNGDVVRVKFLLYGTIIYVWRFRTQHDDACVHSFVMSQREMNSRENCSGSVTGYGNDKAIVLDVIVMPGMFDTNGNVDGLMYSRDVEKSKAKVNEDKESLFSPLYEMPLTRGTGDCPNCSLYTPEEVQQICSCDKTVTDPDKCYFSLSDYFSSTAITKSQLSCLLVCLSVGLIVVYDSLT